MRITSRDNRGRRLRFSLNLGVVLIAITFLERPALANEDIDGRPRVRPLHPVAERLVRQGRRASASFAGLLRALETSDVTVYVGVNFDSGPGPQGALSFMGAGVRHRYLRVELSTGTTSWPTLPEDVHRLITILAHELQHANEVAEHDVWDQDDFVALYREIGRQTSQNTFETEAAKHMAEKVRGELR